MPANFTHHPIPIHCLLTWTDELLEQFLESFPEETAAVQLQLMTATVKLFLKKPVEKPQQLIQLVLTYATQVGAGWAQSVLPAQMWGVGCECGWPANINVSDAPCC